ncbi:MAG: transposase [Candidatus Zambryskibacteria bacterium]|nr:transposase [Candidatus Zambryskibacteria bacterium]
MKNRDYKKFVCGSIFHVYNRGNNKEIIFYDEEDYRAFLFRLGLALGFEFKELLENPLTSIPASRIRITNSKKGLFKLHAFCLMKNHFHLLIEQCSDVPISKLISKVCTSYAMYINKKYKRVGHVFQDKFKAVLVENHAQLMWTSAYIHTNPVKDGYTSHPSKYKWSSFNDYVLNRNLPLTYKDMLESVVKSDFEKETLELMKDMSRTALDTLDTWEFK